jgi:hypothetical protein
MGYRAFRTAEKTLQEIEMMDTISKDEEVGRLKGM